ncbi:MAG TPA: hypothetical protein VM846_00950 [Vicinamibacterales bacterium]|nr:hypothetical protein [Vicinamibacterales bacterium]
MTEPLRNAPASEESAEADRDALIERLLLAGLDHYFEGQYEQAVNVWTRVAFLERGHGRARAYIERARGALAERQRQSDELVHRGLDAYRSGDLGAARDLLTRAVADGGSETALVFLQRLGVAEAGLAAASPLPHARHDGSAAVRSPYGRRSDSAPVARPTNWIATIVVSAAIAGAILLAAQPIASWLGDQPATGSAGNTDAAEPVTIVRTADLRLARARELFQAGQFHDALRQLDAIDRGDALRGDADTLQSLIQTALLAHTVPTSQGEATR